MAYGLIVRVHHTGKAADSVFLSDVDTAIDDQGSFRKAGGVYVPTPAKGGYVDLVYTRIVSISFETGAIRQFENEGYVWTEFIIGSILGPAIFPEVQDEGVTVDPATQIFNFTGAGVTATQTVAGEVKIDIPGGGGGDHALLLNLAWLVSGHTGNPNTIAGFDGAGATRFYLIGTDVQAWDADLDSLAALAGTGVMVRTGAAAYALRTITGTAGNITVANGDGVGGNPTIDVGANVILTTTALGGDLSGFLPNPSVVDLTIAGEQQGSILYFNGVNWVQLAPGAAGQQLTTGGPGANPSWSAAGSGVTTQLLWGDNSVGSSTTTRYLTPGYDDNLAQTIPVQIRVVRAGTLRNFRVRHNVPAGNGNPIVYTFRVNGIATALSVSLASTFADGSDLANSVVVAVGDLVDIQVTKASSVASSPNDIAATVEYA